jgi:hypothetical protein
MDIKKEKKAIQAEAEQELGYPLVKKFWDAVEDDVGNAAEDFDGDPEGQKEYIGCYRNVASRYVELLQIIQRVKPSTDGNGEQSKHKKIYRKCFERRFYMVDFVEEKGYDAVTRRIDWKRTATEWNKAHPSDTMRLPVLKAEYYRAMREGPLLKQRIIMLAAKKATFAVEMATWFRERYQEYAFASAARTSNTPAWDALTFSQRVWESDSVVNKLEEMYRHFRNWVLNPEFFNSLFDFSLIKKNHPSYELLLGYTQSLLDILNSIQEIRESQLLEKKKQLKEA